MRSVLGEREREFEVTIRHMKHSDPTAGTVLFMHGHGPDCGLALWSKFFEPLSAAGFSLLCFDCPGFGECNL